MLKDGRGHWQVWVANARLSGAKRLTSGAYDSGWPVWSPGRQNAYFRQRPNRSHAKRPPACQRRLPDEGRWIWREEADRLQRNERGRRVVTERIIDRVRRRPRKLQGAKRHLRHERERRKAQEDHQAGAAHERLQTSLLAGRNTPRSSCAREGPRRAHRPLSSPSVSMGRVSDGLTSFSLRADDSDWAPDGKRIVFEAYPNPCGVRRHLRRRRKRRPGGQSDSEPRWSGGLRRSSLVAGRTQDPLPRHSSREWRRANGACDDEARRL